METNEVLASVTAERDDLDAKLIALSDYRNGSDFNALPEKQQALLLMQLNAMTLYLDVLNMRIDEMEPEAAPPEE
ncbi:hypothetical protein BIZ83_gp198 [Erwinia phage vB_EamM_ChrisDB]|uniref:hypothetical protein n=1 Tax=Erwinia phage vB_EamM_ChrisDB TaxID=1883371 RepID=UPI00081C7A83|nr:hypothetical protein BIZ83_gp198 [Erwinia phage vB_EamM_ChrisDB]ANZ48655.1 hypothetical protein CHRISDB_93 [Erwinia phage vB_EamM_ChrisDB]